MGVEESDDSGISFVCVCKTEDHSTQNVPQWYPCTSVKKIGGTLPLSRNIGIFMILTEVFLKHKK